MKAEVESSRGHGEATRATPSRISQVTYPTPTPHAPAHDNRRTLGELVEQDTAPPASVCIDKQGLWSRCWEQKAPTSSIHHRPPQPPLASPQGQQAPHQTPQEMKGATGSRFGKAVKYISLFPIAYLSLLAGA